MENFRQGHARDPPRNMHSPVFRLLTAKEWGGACTSWSSGRGDASPVTVVLPFLAFLSLTLSKGLFKSHQMSRIVGPISKFFEIGSFPKMEKYWAVPPTNILAFQKLIPKYKSLEIICKCLVDPNCRSYPPCVFQVDCFWWMILLRPYWQDYFHRIFQDCNPSSRTCHGHGLGSSYRIQYLV